MSSFLSRLFTWGTVLAASHGKLVLTFLDLESQEIFLVVWMVGRLSGWMDNGFYPVIALSCRKKAVFALFLYVFMFHVYERVYKG